MNILSCTFYAVLLDLVLVVGCGKEEVEKSKAKATPKTEPKGETKKTEQSGATAKKDEAEGWVSDPSDPNNVKIDAAIRVELKKPTGELTEGDLDKVTKLDIQRIGEDLDENQLTDVTVLENLTQLKELNLRFNQLTDVKGLEKLKHLTMLHLGGNELTDVEGLKKLTQLTELYLGGNQLTSVKGLILVYNQLTDVKGLENLSQGRVDLSYNPALTKAQIAELQRALPKCKIEHNAKK